MYKLWKNLHQWSRFETACDKIPRNPEVQYLWLGIGKSCAFQTHFEIKFECETCDKVYNRSDNLQKHKLICGTDIVKVVEAPVTINCETCGKSFTKKRYLQQHRRAHGGAKKMVQYDCKFCDKMFASNQSLGKHIEKNHPNPRRVEDANIGFLVLDSSPPCIPLPKKQRLYSCKQCT